MHITDSNDDCSPHSLKFHFSKSTQKVFFSITPIALWVCFPSILQKVLILIFLSFKNAVFLIKVDKTKAVYLFASYYKTVYKIDERERTAHVTMVLNSERY